MSWIGGSWRVMIDGKYVWPALKGNWNKRIHQTLQGNIQTKEINKGLSTSASINCLSTKWRHPFKTPARYFRAATGIQDFNMPNFSIFPWFAPQVCLQSQSKVWHCSLEIHRVFLWQVGNSPPSPVRLHRHRAAAAAGEAPPPARTLASEKIRILEMEGFRVMYCC